MNRERFDWANQWRVDMDMTTKEGEAALAAVKKDMPSKAQTRYNQRDIKKRRMKKAMNKMIKMIMLLPVFFMGCKCVCEKPQPPKFSPLPPENFLRPINQTPHQFYQDGQRMKDLERELKNLKKKYNLPYVPLNIAYKSITKEDYIIKENCA